MAKTSRREHPYPEAGNPADVPKWMKDLATNLDDVALDDQGARAERPAAGESGNYYFATDEEVLYRDNGSAWNNVSDVRWYKPLYIETNQSRENTSYGKLTTPDEIAGVEVADGNVVLIGYQALWQSSKQEKGRAAIFIGANQLKVPTDEAGTPLTTAAVSGGAAAGSRLNTFPGGLIAASGPMSYAIAGDVTTGTALSAYVQEALPMALEINGASKAIAAKSAPTGGFCVVMGIAAGTYAISVQFKASEGKVEAKNRRLVVGVIG